MKAVALGTNRELWFGWRRGSLHAVSSLQGLFSVPWCRGDAYELFDGRMIPKRCISSKDDLAIDSFPGQSFLGVQKLGRVETAMRCLLLWVHNVLESASPKFNECCSIIFLRAVSVFWDRSRETARTGLWLGGPGKMFRVEVNLVTLSVTVNLRQLMFMSLSFKKSSPRLLSLTSAM